MHILEFIEGMPPVDNDFQKHPNIPPACVFFREVPSPRLKRKPPPEGRGFRCQLRSAALSFLLVNAEGELAVDAEEPAAVVELEVDAVIELDLDLPAVLFDGSDDAFNHCS